MNAILKPDLATLPPPAPIQQLHHYAYKARDAEETRQFYEDILGLPLYHIIQSDYAPSRPLWVNHIAFRVDPVQELENTKKPLEARGIGVLGVTDHHIFHSI